AGLRLRSEWDQLEGAVGVWLWSRPLGGSAGSISLWRDEAALRGFVGWAPHVEVVRRYRGAGRLLALSWQAERSRFASHWAQAQKQRSATVGRVGWNPIPKRPMSGLRPPPFGLGRRKWRTRSDPVRGRRRALREEIDYWDD